LDEEPTRTPAATPTGLAFDGLDRQAHALRRAALGQINCGLAERLERAVDGVASVCAAVRRQLQHSRDEVFFESQ
jgi:hypothetical protein